MKIYIAHSREFDYENELYLPLKKSQIFKKHELILPHDGPSIKHDRDYYKKIDLYIAECSYPATGLGIELGFAFDDKKPVYCLYKKDNKISSSINLITNNIYEYSSTDEMLNIIESIINK